MFFFPVRNLHLRFNHSKVFQDERQLDNHVRENQESDFNSQWEVNVNLKKTFQIKVHFSCIQLSRNVKYAKKPLKVIKKLYVILKVCTNISGYAGFVSSSPICKGS